MLLIDMFIKNTNVPFEYFSARKLLYNKYFNIQSRKYTPVRIFSKNIIQLIKWEIFWFKLFLMAFLNM